MQELGGYAGLNEVVNNVVNNDVIQSTYLAKMHRTPDLGSY